MKPEGRARGKIDQKLPNAGWDIRNAPSINQPGRCSGIAVREYLTDTGPADYLLFG
jgi:type I restriction enzyme R subunit